MKGLMTLVLLLGALSFASADETVSEKVEAKGHKARHTMKKGANRVKEAICQEGDVKCLAKKGKHRVQEGTEAVGDKTKETVNKAD